MMTGRYVKHYTLFRFTHNKYLDQLYTITFAFNAKIFISSCLTSCMLNVLLYILIIECYIAFNAFYSPDPYPFFQAYVSGE